MVNFRQKNFAEYDAMHSLYNELIRFSGDKTKFRVIDTSALIPILKGNNVVIEKFAISTRSFGDDKYRMYLKIGAKAKMPDDVRLPSRYYDKTLAQLELRANPATFDGGGGEDGGNKKKKSPPFLSAGFSNKLYLQTRVSEILGDAVKYDKKSRSLVLEFDTIQNAIRALNVLPFGINYQIYLLN